MKWAIVGIIIVCNAFADVLNTLGMRRNGEVRDFAPRGIFRLLRRLARNGYVLAGIVAMIFSFGALIKLLSISPVSFAIPATAGSVIIETLLAKLILKEDIHWERWLGAILVACGVALLALP